MAKVKRSPQPNVTESQIKAALSALDKRRAADHKLAQGARAERARVRRTAQKVLTPYWRKTGLEVAAFETARANAQVERRRLVDQQLAAVRKQSVSVAKMLRDGARSWHETVDRLRLPDVSLTSPFVPGYIVIDKPFIIWPTNGLELEDSHIEPGNNWAKISGQSSKGSGEENLRFIFVFENPNDSFTAVNIASYLRLNGSCRASADGGTAGIFPGGSSHLHLKAFLNVWEWWNQPPTRPVGEATQTRDVLNLSADGGGYFESVGDIEVQAVSGNFDVTYQLFVLPPNGVGVFEVTLLVSYDNDDGEIAVYFASDSFEVMCPLVAVAVLT
jgi:hypothetical protein